MAMMGTDAEIGKQQREEGQKHECGACAWELSNEERSVVRDDKSV